MIETIHWHTLHPRYLGIASRILDLGANYGHFTEAVSKRFGCYCVAVEPTPDAFSAIRVSSKISKINAAVGERSGTMPFYVSNNSVESSFTPRNGSREIQIPVFSLADLMSKVKWNTLDLLKLDIEGAEIGVFASAPDSLLQQIAQITVEFHDFCGITSAKVVKKTLAHLHDLGFYSVRMSRIGHQDTWLINRRVLSISTHELQSIRYVQRNWVGLKRVASRYTARLSR